MIFGKKIAYWIEIGGGIILGLVMAIITFSINPSYNNWKGFIQEFPTIGMCAFGFLLTLLSIIIQGNSPNIERMKSRTNLFNRFILFNKRIVMLSLISSLYSYLLGYLNFNWIIDGIHVDECFVLFAEKFLLSLFTFLFIWFIVDVIHFIRLFYVLIKE